MPDNQTYNKKIVNNIIDNLKINPITDIVPKTVLPTIQPVFEVERKVCDIVRGSITTSTSATIFTTSATTDFYLTGVTLGYSKDSLQDTATGRCNVNVFVNGTAREILSLPFVTLTAQNDCFTLELSTPLKVDRNTAISLSRGASTAGTFALAGNIVGYTEETAVTTT